MLIFASKRRFIKYTEAVSNDQQTNCHLAASDEAINEIIIRLTFQGAYY